MKQKSVILSGITILLLLTASFILAQQPREKNIKLVAGQKLILKDTARSDSDLYLDFKARRGQHLTVKLITGDANFTVNTLNDFEVLAFTEETKFWSGKLTEGYTSRWSLTLTTTRKSAPFTLEILLK